MPAPVLNKANAKVGDLFKGADGNTWRRELSPYANDGHTTHDVLQGAYNATATGPVGGVRPNTMPVHYLTQKQLNVAQPMPEPTAAQAATPAGPVQETPLPIQPDAPPPSPGVIVADVRQQGQDQIEESLEPGHLKDLADRQATADANDAALDAAHAALDAQKPPAVIPDDPSPSNRSPVGPYASPASKDMADPVYEASMLPSGMIPDLARGAVEAPDMMLTGAKHAVSAMLGMADMASNFVNGPDIAERKAIGIPNGGASNVRAAFDSALPDTEDSKPHSVTGGLIQGVSQFAAGWAVGGKILDGWKVAAGAGAIAKGFAQGALTDFGAFDGSQGHLVDVLKGHAPAAVEPLVDLLAASPGDTEAMGRFKNAIEGLGLGAAFHGVLSAAGALRAARITQRAAALSARAEGLQGVIDAPQPQVVAEANQFHSDMADALGDPNAESFTTTRPAATFRLSPKAVSDHADAALAGGGPGANTIGLNYAKISDSADLQAAAVQLYDAYHPEITAAKRGVQTIDQQVQDAFGADVAKMLGDWKPGTAMVSSDLTAMRFAQASAMSDLVGHARAIAAGDGSLATQAAFLQTGHIADAMSRVVEGGKAEAARTLQSLRQSVPDMTGDLTNPADAVEFYRKVDAMIAGGGGADMVQRAAKGFLTVAAGNPLGTSTFLRGLKALGGGMDRSKEVLKVFITNGLLTVGGITNNVIGNTGALVWERMMRGLAPHLANAAGAPSYIADGEAVASHVGMISAFGDLFRLSDHVNNLGDLLKPESYDKPFIDFGANLDAAKAKTKGFIPSHREEVNVSQGGTNGIGMAGLDGGPQGDTALGRVASLIYKAIKIPGQVHGVLDDFSNIISGRAELASQAYRRATKDSELGLITADQIGAQMQKHMEDPDAAMLGRVIDAQQNTSWTRKPDTSQASITNAVKGFRSGLDSLPIPLPLGTSIFPYINTPANLFSYGIQNSIFAPLSSRFRAAVMSTDGATRQLALTKYAAGSLMSLWIMNHVANGDMTGGGPRDPAQREAMMRVDPQTHATIWQPYSVRLGDHWVDLSRLEPFATNYALAADMSEAWLGNDWSDARVATATDAFAATAMSIGDAFMSKSTMQGARQLMDAMAAYKRGDVTAPDQFVEQRAVAMLPFSAVAMAGRKMLDPNIRLTTGLVDAFKNTVPGLSKDLPESTDLWGRPRTYDTGMGTAYDMVIPARTHPIGAEPADREMLRLGFAPTMPAKSITLPGGKTADLRNYPSIYNQILTRGGPHALNELNDLVTGASPQSDYYASLADGSDVHLPGSKAKFINDRLRFWHEQATASVRRDFTDELQGIAADQANRKAAARVNLNQ